MVVENLNVAPLLEWLLGPGWYQGALFHGPALVLVVVLAVAGAAALFFALRRGPVLPGTKLGAVTGAVMAGLVALGVAVAAIGLLGAGSVLGPVAAGLGHTLATLLGPSWFEGSLYRWLAVVASLVAAVFVIGWLVTALRSGPVGATTRSGQVLADVAIDLARTSPRRVLALAWLAVRESIRRKVVVVFIVFVVLLLFGGWFLNPASDQPARLYIQFVLTATIYLTLGFALILSALSLPADIKDHTLHTVVTKPVRKLEIVLGRILGFGLVGSVLLAGMGTASYVFTVRGLQHTHQLTAADLHDEPLPGNREPLKKGLTSRNQRHQHEVMIDPSGAVVVENKHGHWHELTVEGKGADAVYKLGPPQGLLVARVPIYGKLRFRDQTGKDAEKGVNVGDEWAYRSFVAGGTRAAAIWSFAGITSERFPESMFPDSIPVEMTIEVFRTYKGDVEKPILGSLWLRNPQTGRKVDVRNFLAKKFATDVQWIPRKLTSRDAGRTETLDLFRDLVSDDGRLEIGIQCLEASQYFGMAQADMYFRARDASFTVNFIKGYLGIWMQMLLVLALGVTFSTFLSGSVALIATLGFVVAGLFGGYVAALSTGGVIGGGPFESAIRLMTQQNQISEMDPGLQTNVAVMSDRVVQGMLWTVSALLPAFDSFDFVDYVAFGFDVSGGMFFRSVFQALGFLLPVAVIGYFFLKMREVAK